MTYFNPHRPSVTMVQMPKRRPGLGDVWDDLAILWEPVVPADQADPADNVTQFANGTTTTAADFTSVNGVCKPSNFPALAVVQSFQTQLNRVAQVKGFPKIAADGSIGPATMALFRSVQAISAGQVMGDATSCMGVAPDVDVIGQQIQTLANSLNAPATVAPATSLSVPTITTKSGQTVASPSNSGLLGQFATLSSIEKIAIVGVAGAIGWMLVSGKKKTPRTTSAPASRRRRR